MTEWQPIDTAPKDGRAILLLSKGSEHEASYRDGTTEYFRNPPKCHIGKWNAEGDAWTDEGGGFEGEICTLTVTGIWDSGGGWFQPNEVTHWMELPQPPSTVITSEE